ncbi:MAG: tRNA pseudouridine(55) synthase TruB [Bacteroidales bacterium]|nr:tRNA pseudouridine(55) synthase TruB [Bacteroidales bacterium]MBR5532578.1 tRNA pseudouridine(55) synthase TruB [Bacteroidales bacterium]
MDRDFDFIGGEILHFNKPLHWTSFKLVKKLRGHIHQHYGIKKFKVGHAGTLDPLATGVMTICTGKATKLIESLQGEDKEYITTIALGATTPSFDLETEIDQTYPTQHITRERVEEVLTSFVGEIEQVPPIFSACKIDGERAYKLARKGDDVELKAKVIRIDEIELLEFSQTSIRIRVACGKGTYIRSLARDIGFALESGGHLTELIRTRVGKTKLEDCYSVDDIADIVSRGIALKRE